MAPDNSLIVSAAVALHLLFLWLLVSPSPGSALANIPPAPLAVGAPGSTSTATQTSTPGTATTTTQTGTPASTSQVGTVSTSTAQTTSNTGTIYVVPGTGTKSGKPYVGRHNNQQHRVTITVEAFSGKSKIFLPDCGAEGDGTELLCMAEVQTKTAGEWRAMQPKYSKAGSQPASDWGVQIIPPGGSRDFIYRFVRDEWQVETGQPLRVVVKAWKDERSMKTLHGGVLLRTAPFMCP